MYIILPRFSRNSEASASEFLENVEEMFPVYKITVWTYSRRVNVCSNCFPKIESDEV